MVSPNHIKATKKNWDFSEWRMFVPFILIAFFLANLYMDKQDQVLENCLQQSYEVYNNGVKQKLNYTLNECKQLLSKESN